MKYIYSVYIIIGAALVPILNNFWDILGQTYSWWLAPLMVVGFVVLMTVLQIAAVLLWICFVNREKSPERGQNLFRFLLGASLPVIVKLAGVKIITSGLEKLPEDRRMLFVCNHQHDFDPVVLYNVFPDQKLGFIGKKEIYQTMPFISRAMHKLYSLPIDRENNREGAKTIIKAVKILKEEKASILLFPEGYTSPTCELLPFRNGSLKVATKAGVPIAVCVINNTRSIPKNILRRRTVVEVRLLDVIYPEAYEELNTTELGDQIHEKMLTALNDMRK